MMYGAELLFLSAIVREGLTYYICLLLWLSWSPLSDMHTRPVQVQTKQVLLTEQQVSNETNT